MEHEYDDRPIPSFSCLHHSGQEGLFFLIFEMTWRGGFLSHQLDNFCWIIGDAFCGQQPCEVPLETDQAAIDRVWLEVQNVLQVGAVVSERWCGHPFRSERRFFLSSLLPDGFTPGGKVTQIAEIVANSDIRQVFFDAKSSFIVCKDLFSTQSRDTCKNKT